MKPRCIHGQQFPCTDCVAGRERNQKIYDQILTDDEFEKLYLAPFSSWDVQGLPGPTGLEEGFRIRNTLTEALENEARTLALTIANGGDAEAEANGWELAAVVLELLGRGR